MVVCDAGIRGRYEVRDCRAPSGLAMTFKIATRSVTARAIFTAVGASPPTMGRYEVG